MRKWIVVAMGGMASAMLAATVTLDGATEYAVARRNKDQPYSRFGNMAYIAFPSMKSMTNSYAWLKKAPVLLPAAWIIRLGKYALDSLKGRKKQDDNSEMMRIGSERIEMMRKYGIL